MTRLKTLSLPLWAAIFVSAASQAPGQVNLNLVTQKAFRQYSKTDVQFLAGEFQIELSDGNATYQCADFAYFPPSPPCPDGATGFLGFGNPDPNLPDPPTYYMVTGITPAILVDPLRPDFCLLKAAPASALKRPQPGFVDRSFSLFYSIAPGSVSIREYPITRYVYERTYLNASGGRRMANEIVPGVYHFSFPRLDRPTIPVAIPITHYPIPNGYQKIGNTATGVRFNGIKRFESDGFVRIDKNWIQTFKWEGNGINYIYPGADKLYFSIRNLRNPLNAKSNVIYTNANGIPISIFPNVVSGADPRVLLDNPLVTSYVMPPLVATGTRGVVELELVRDATTNGVTHDISTRRYQLPVYFVDQYSEFKKRAFFRKTTATGLLDDFDGDGYNNLTEWVLESRANDKGSIPRMPVPRYQPPVLDGDRVAIPGFWYFLVDKRKGLFPAVRYALQRSKDNGRTWVNFTGDAYWNLIDNEDEIGIVGDEVGTVGEVLDPNEEALPPELADDLYRVKITVAR